MTSKEGSNIDYVRVTVPLCVLESISEEQVERLRVLIGGFGALSATLTRDSWTDENVLFTLHGMNDVTLLHGLIEIDGRANT